MSWHKEPAQEFQEVTTAKDRSITIWFCMHAIYTEHSFPHSLVPDISGDKHSGNNALQLEDNVKQNSRSLLCFSTSKGMKLAMMHNCSSNRLSHSEEWEDPVFADCLHI